MEKHRLKMAPYDWILAPTEGASSGWVEDALAVGIPWWPCSSSGVVSCWLHNFIMYWLFLRLFDLTSVSKLKMLGLDRSLFGLMLLRWFWWGGRSVCEWWWCWLFSKWWWWLLVLPVRAKPFALRIGSVGASRNERFNDICFLPSGKS